MQSMKVIKRRKASVSSTQKVMKAMDLVATSKLQKAKARLEASRPLFQETKLTIDSLKNLETTRDNIFVRQREVKNTAVVLITSDRGLCGGYNTNVAEKAMSFIRTGKNEKIFAVGLKGWEYFRRRGKNIVRRYVGVSETAFYEDAEIIGNLLCSMYVSGEVDEIFVAYTRFESVLSHVPRLEKVFPIGDGSDVPYQIDTMRFEPDADTFISFAAPAYLNSIIYASMVESTVCEQAARMVNMDAAANNATEIIDDLSRMYNRIRQSTITQEINEIVSGASVRA